MSAPSNPSQPDELAKRFAEHRERLRALVQLRMDRRLSSRFDPSDVLQEAFIEASRRYVDYVAQPDMSIFLWLRFLTVQRLLQLHRTHLGTQKRDVKLELSLPLNPAPIAASETLAECFVGNFTSPSQAFEREELQLRIQRVLESLRPLDREMLALRHFEELSNDEVAHVLDISKSTASNRYIRALQRFRLAMEATGWNSQT